jgi:hypothetical protein
MCGVYSTQTIRKVFPIVGKNHRKKPTCKSHMQFKEHYLNIFKGFKYDNDNNCFGLGLVLVFDIRVQEVGFWYCKVKVMLIPDGL